jgi:hypothetical protein
METKFKVGDRVRHERFGEGIVRGEHDEMVAVEFDKAQELHDCYGKCAKGKGWYCEEKDLTLITSAQPAPPTHPDRADYAFGFARTMLEKTTEFNELFLARTPIEAVALADALIAELQRPKQ